jgi:hypothetical protein
MKIAIEIEDQKIKDQIITALEGGSNYWYYLKDLSMLPAKKEGEALSERIARAVMDEDISVPVYDIEDEDECLGFLNKGNIQRGLTIMAGEYPQTTKDIIMEQGDATTADVFFQHAVMGEMVFG